MTSETSRPSWNMSRPTAMTEWRSDWNQGKRRWWQWCCVCDKWTGRDFEAHIYSTEHRFEVQRCFDEPGHYDQNVVPRFISGNPERDFPEERPGIERLRV